MTLKTLMAVVILLQIRNVLDNLTVLLNAHPKKSHLFKKVVKIMPIIVNVLRKVVVKVMYQELGTVSVFV